jgi:hypothetical protein
LSLLACGQVVDPMPDEGAAGSAPMDSPAGSGSTVNPTNAAGGMSVEPVPGGSGGVGGARAVPPTDRDGGAKVDASLPPLAADGGSVDAGTVSTEPLCDGSSAMRLTFESGGGFVDQLYFFTNPHGHAFLAIDGKCQFYVGQNYMRGIATGTLTEAEAAELSKDVHWFELAGWDWNVNKDAPCPDSGGISLTRAKITAGCSCGCDDAAPKGLNDALSNASKWIDRLMTEGKPVTGPLSAVAFTEAGAGTTNLPFVQWPLARSMSSIMGLVHEPSAEYLSATNTMVAHFDDPTEVMQLRAARVATVSHDTNGSVGNSVPVKEGSLQYRLYARDELPNNAEMAWQALKGTLPAP